MATDSYFAATLVGKLLRKIVQEKGYKELYGLEVITDIDSSLKFIIQELFKELNVTKNQLLLDKEELLTTLIVLLIDKKENRGIVLVIGDGLVSINGKVTEFDQDNKPDYLGFHLNENFEEWYASQIQKIEFDSVHDISIATDGIFMFAPVKKVDATETINPVEFLLSDKGNEEEKEMLTLKLKRLEHGFGLKPTDDLALIRIIA